MTLDPAISGAIMDLENRILNLSTTGGDPAEVTRLTNQVNALRSELASKLESKTREEENFKKDMINKITNIQREVDNKNNRAA